MMKCNKCEKDGTISCICPECVEKLEEDLDSVEDHAIALGKKLGQSEFDCEKLKKQLAELKMNLSIMTDARDVFMRRIGKVKQLLDGGK